VTITIMRVLVEVFVVLGDDGTDSSTRVPGVRRTWAHVVVSYLTWH
jgi:hypothetical protein